MSNNEKSSVVLTDAEIKKALECCISAENCCECVYTKMCDGTTIHQFALDLINRQQAEFERLQKLLEGWKTEAYKVADEKDKLYCEAVERVKTTKTEAIKELMFNLDNEISTYSSEGKGLNVYAWLKNYAKEMAVKTNDF